MLKDLNREDWLAALGLSPDQIPAMLVLRGTRNLRRHFAAHAALFEDVVEVGSPNALFEDVLVGRYGGVPVGYASVYGPAMASEIAHVFGALGTPVLVQTGVCGALGDHVGAGDLVVATAAGCGDGAAACYLPGQAVVEATPALVDRLTARPSPVPRHVGPVWTTAALLAEGRAEVDAWHDAGYIAVDMETASAFAVAEHFGMARAAILSAYDNPRRGEHLLLDEAHKSAARAAGEAAALAAVLALVADQPCLPVASQAPVATAARP
ncbi:MAG: hypothetical protein AVDCRST_MAG49-3630 [uncultured Thermomicrobiales bacterium]|uniref:Uridine phosphorylase n=1 Tax=uncultured Thermomicrobiales bacterium TaxID=1645740 RepID=A0A6J4V8H7_9BACT|nr:MAG: hypothetical protein AVDCRST_MAG49-3630 [uncultured Thermomicrobiales bacterium]